MKHTVSPAARGAHKRKVTEGSHARRDWGAEVTVVWGYEPHSIVLTPRNWRRVRSGKPLTIRGKGYYDDDDWFWSYWRFNGPREELVVDYGEDGGCGYNGLLSGTSISEGPYRAGRIRYRSALN